MLLAAKQRGNPPAIAIARSAPGKGKTEAVRMHVKGSAGGGDTEWQTLNDPGVRCVVLRLLPPQRARLQLQRLVLVPVRPEQARPHRAQRQPAVRARPKQDLPNQPPVFNVKSAA